MAESLQKLVESLQAEISNMRAQVSSSRPTVTKDLSLISLIPKWSGTEKSVSVKEFFEIVMSNVVAAILLGNGVGGRMAIAHLYKLVKDGPLIIK